MGVASIVPHIPHASIAVWWISGMKAKDRTCSMSIWKVTSRSGNRPGCGESAPELEDCHELVMSLEG